VSTGSATVLTTSNTVVNTIDYRNTGIILRVAPRISVNGDVRLDIEQEISNVPTTSANSLTPTVSERGSELDLGGDRPDRAAGGLISDSRAATAALSPGSIRSRGSAMRSAIKATPPSVPS